MSFVHKVGMFVVLLCVTLFLVFPQVEIFLVTMAVREIRLLNRDIELG